VRRLPALTIAAALPLALLVLTSPGEAASAPSAKQLTFGKNTYAYNSSYGEPGLAIGPKHEVYVTTPGEGGAVLAKSTNRGATWTKLKTVVPPADSPGTFTSGGDSEVAVAKDGTVYVGDLDLDGIQVSKSTDGGKTFPLQTFVGSTADREWLATDGPHGEYVYVVWHELATGTMLVATSSDGAQTFSTPFPIYSNPETVVQSAHNGTSIGQINVDHHGRAFVTYGVSRLTTTDTTYGSPPITTIKISVKAREATTWTDYTVNPGADDANYGNFWMAAAADSADNLYAVYSGYAHKGQPMHVWLQESTDHGATWTAPYAVDKVLPGADGQDLFGWVAGGGPGVAVVSWYHTAAPNKDAAKIDWTVPVAQVRGLKSGKPQLIYGVASDHSIHNGPICTLGLFCGVLPGSADDRSLLDFFKVAVDPDGTAEVTWSDNNRIDGDAKTGVGFARQVGGPSALTSVLGSVKPTGSSGGGTGATGGSSGSGSGGGSLPTTGLGVLVPLLALGLLGGALFLRGRRQE
jgi:hypothetical protein